MMPRVKQRAFQMDLGRQPETLPELKRILRQQARHHYNECHLYLENSIKLSVFGDAADPGGLTPDEFQELQQFGSELGIDVVPSLNLLGHMEKILRHPRFAGLSELAHGPRRPEQGYSGCICPELPESKAFIRQVIAEMCAISRSPKLMVGLDENWTLGSHPLTRARLDVNGGAGAVFRDWIVFLHAEVTSHGKRMWMWEDMLFYHLGALGRIPADIGMCAWHYQHIEHSPAYSFQNWGRIHSLDLLRQHGHPVMLCCGPAPHHLLSMLRYSEGQELEGVLVVQWGGYIVQEFHHLDRAIAGELLQAGRMPALSGIATSVLGSDDATAPAWADWITHWQARPPAKGGGNHACPRFWSWPENAGSLPVIEALVSTRRRLGGGGEAGEVTGLFLEGEWLDRTADVVRETAALTGRQMLQHGMKTSSVFDDAIGQLADALAAVRDIPARAKAIHDRYTVGLKERGMVKGFSSSVATAEDLLQRLRRFQAAPSSENWPFALISLHLDGLTLDACAHRVVVTSRGASGDWKPVYDGSARLPPTLEGEFVMSFPLAEFPREVRLEVGGFASLGIMRVRVETLKGTWLPARVAASGGYCRDPEHLLEFDRKMAVFNEPDVMPKWRSFESPVQNFVILEWDAKLQ